MHKLQALLELAAFVLAFLWAACELLQHLPTAPETREQRALRRFADHWRKP